MDLKAEFDLKSSQLEEVVVPNDLRSAKQPEVSILRRLHDLQYSEDVTFAIKLALEEALTNAVKHGNRNDASKRLVVRYHITPARAVIVVRDEGPGFEVSQVPDPTAEENLERPNGRGIMLMRAYMTKVRYNARGNEVWMLKENQTSPP